MHPALVGCFCTVLLVALATAHLDSHIPPLHVTIKHNKDESIRSLIQEQHFMLDHRRSYTETDAYITQEQWDLLQDHGVDVSLIKEVGKRHLEEVNADPVLSPSGLISYNQYMDHDQLKGFLLNITAQYPSITRLINIGTSVQGRELFVIQISKDPDVNTFEPKFKYIGNMHGDEVVGRMMLLFLIDHLTYSYQHGNTDIVNMIDNTDIYIMPTMNPDGYALGRRGNANNVDLNRNFPDMWTSPDKPISSCEPEVQAVANFSRQHKFVLSANLHGGDLCANYPYDGNIEGKSQEYSRAADDEVFRHLAMTYSINSRTMYQNWGTYGDNFFAGTTNGASWYVLYGGMQDWNYWQTGDFELTLELSFIKWPSATELPTFWGDNINALLAYMAAINKLGIRGQVTDKEGNPLDATITVGTNPTTISADPTNGGYFRLLLPGNYMVTASAPGYTSLSKVIVVNTDTIELLNFKLSPSTSTSTDTSTTHASTSTAGTSSSSGSDSSTTLITSSTTSTGNGKQEGGSNSSKNTMAIAFAVIMSLIVIALGSALFYMNNKYKRLLKVSSNYESLPVITNDS